MTRVHEIIRDECRRRGWSDEAVALVYADAQAAAVVYCEEAGRLELLCKAAPSKVKAFLAIHREAEKKVSAAFQRVVGAMLQHALSVLEGLGPLQPGDEAKLVPHSQRWIEMGRDLVVPVLAEVQAAGASQAMRSYASRVRKQFIVDGDVTLNVPAEVQVNMTMHMRETFGQDYWLRFGDATRRGVQSLLMRSIAQNLSNNEFGNRLKEAYGFSNRRCNAIARTETTMAFNAGHYAVSDELINDPEIPVHGREWVAILDLSVRAAHRHADGQRVWRRGVEWVVTDSVGREIAHDEFFRLDQERARYPGDPNLSAGQRINCRCTIIDVFDDPPEPPKPPPPLLPPKPIEPPLPPPIEPPLPPPVEPPLPPPGVTKPKKPRAPRKPKVPKPAAPQGPVRAVDEPFAYGDQSWTELDAIQHVIDNHPSLQRALAEVGELKKTELTIDDVWGMHRALTETHKEAREYAIKHHQYSVFQSVFNADAEAVKYREKINSLRTTVMDMNRELDKLPDLEKVSRVLGNGTVNKKFTLAKKSAKKGTTKEVADEMLARRERAEAFVRSVVSEDMLSHKVQVKLLSYDGRSFHRMVRAKDYATTGAMQSEVHMGLNADAWTWAHEIGHSIEEVNKDVQKAIQRWKKARIVKAGKEDVDLHKMFPKRFDPGERGNPDDFTGVGDDIVRQVYCGKEYSWGSTEVLSMGIEHLYQNPVAFAKADPDMFKFIVGCLNGTIDKAMKAVHGVAVP